MRIIAGGLGGRQIDAPHVHRTHPMSEKMRGGLFNTLGDIEGLTVLDAFAGSGALSFEAISRGASHTTTIELDKNAQKLIERNIKSLGLENKVKLIRANSSSWSDNNTDALFDIVLLDPPYDGVKPKLLEKLVNHTKLKGVTVISLPSKYEFNLNSKFQLLASKSYGDAQLVFYRRIS